MARARRDGQAPPTKQDRPKHIARALLAEVGAALRAVPWYGGTGTAQRLGFSLMDPAHQAGRLVVWHPTNEDDLDRPLLLYRPHAPEVVRDATRDARARPGLRCRGPL
jgi:hypothetical protein